MRRNSTEKNDRTIKKKNYTRTLFRFFCIIVNIEKKFNLKPYMMQKKYAIQN
jgi:hypothetical protein